MYSKNYFLLKSSSVTLADNSKCRSLSLNIQFVMLLCYHKTIFLVYNGILAHFPHIATTTKDFIEVINLDIHPLHNAICLLPSFDGILLS